MTTATKPRLTFPIEHYDRFIPLLDRTAQADDVDFEVLQGGVMRTVVVRRETSKEYGVKVFDDKE